MNPTYQGLKLRTGLGDEHKKAFSVYGTAWLVGNKALALPPELAYRSAAAAYIWSSAQGGAVTHGLPKAN